MATQFIYETNSPESNTVAADNDDIICARLQKALRQTGGLQKAVFNSVNFSSIVTDDKGIIRILNIGAERTLYHEVVARAKALRTKLETMISPDFKTGGCNASPSIDYIRELTCIREDNSYFPAIVSVTSLRDDQSAIIGYLLIGTYHTPCKLTNKALLKAEALESAIFQQRQLIERNLKLESISPTAFSPKKTECYRYSRTACSHDSFRGGQRLRRGGDEELTHTNETGKYDD